MLKRCWWMNKGMNNENTNGRERVSPPCSRAWKGRGRGGVAMEGLERAGLLIRRLL